MNYFFQVAKIRLPLLFTEVPQVYQSLGATFNGVFTLQTKKPKEEDDIAETSDEIFDVAGASDETFDVAGASDETFDNICDVCMHEKHVEAKAYCAVNTFVMAATRHTAD